jgi:hypothetical protein
MAKIEAKREFPDKAANECYQVCVSLIDQAGYKIFKQRDLANLVICNGEVAGAAVNLSIMVPFLGGPTSVNVNLSSSAADENVLQAEADRILDLIASKL